MHIPGILYLLSICIMQNEEMCINDAVSGVTCLGLAVQLKNTSREKCIIEISRRVLSISIYPAPAAAAQPVVAGNGYDTMTQAGPGPAAAGLIHRTVFDLAAVPACPILSIRM